MAEDPFRGAETFTNWQNDVIEYVKDESIKQGLFIPEDPEAAQNDPNPPPPVEP